MLDLTAAQIVAYHLSMSSTRFAHEIGRHRPPKPVTRVFLSDEAFDKLLERAAGAGYRHAESTTAKGLAAYLDAVFGHPHQVWADTRPDHYKEGDAIVLDPASLNPRLPKWLPDRTEAMNPRRVRGIRGELPLDAIYEVGLHHGITSERLARSDSGLNRSVVISATLEAFGLGHITPSITPQSTRVIRHSRHAYKELGW